jgi:uncharacterized cupredoxin-like copper-binding protein
MANNVTHAGGPVNGTVVIACHQPGHWESGMKATVTVS